MTTLGINVTPTTVSMALIRNNEIIDAIMHVFDKAEKPNGSSPAATRREFRLARRQVKRRRWRKEHVVKIFKKHFNINIDPIKVSGLNPWQLREDALSRVLSDIELFKVLSHLSRRRGFKSSRKDAAKEDEDKSKKKMLEGISILKKELLNSPYKTIGQYLCYQSKKKNHPNNYERTVDRNLIYDEVKLIFEKQKELGSKLVTDSLVNDFWANITWQAHIKSTLDMVGFCTYEQNEKRAAKHTYTAECFTVLSDLANLKLLDRSRNTIEIDHKAKQEIFNLALKQKEITYAALRKKLKISPEHTFNSLSYFQRKTLKTKVKEDFEKGIRTTDKPHLDEVISDCEKNTVFIKMEGYHTLKDCITDADEYYWGVVSNDTDLLDEIVTLISCIQDENELQLKLRELKVPDNVVVKLLGISNFSKTKHLSLKAMRKMIPHLAEFIPYLNVLPLVGYNSVETSTKSNLLPAFKTTVNPVVNRALSRTRKVLNAVIRKHGLPDNIHIELSRDLPRSAEERRKMTISMRNNTAYNTEVKAKAEMIFKRTPTHVEVEKYKLWLEQNKISFYSGKPISEAHLADPTYTEIDYIIPFARSFDNSMDNKVLCFADENRNKDNKTPYEMFGNGIFWEGIVERSKTMNYEKSGKILVKDFNERVERLWQDRYLNDTRYIARLLKEHISCLDLKGSVHIRRAPAINYLKSIWGLYGRIHDIRDYVVDAFVIAACTDSMMNKISKFNKYKKYIAKAKGITEPPKPDVPWLTFKDDVIEKTSNVFVSKTPVGKMTGCAHAEQLCGVQWTTDKDYKVLKRIELTKLTIKNIEHMVDKDTANKGLYALLKGMLEGSLTSRTKTTGKGKVKEEMVADAKKIFASGVIYNGIPVRKVKCYSDRVSGLFVRKGIAINKENVRSLDIFLYKGKHYLRPNYTAQIAKNKLASHCENLDVKINEEFKHVVNLFKNDYVEFVLRDDKVVSGYFISSNPASNVPYGAITLIQHDAESLKDNGIFVSLGTVKEIRKYFVDYFGNRFLIKQ
jgi:CRISPR-associated endonuclease Csn1